MKKFIIFAVSLVVTLAIVVGLFFIFREKETLTISPSSVTVNTYEYFSVEVSSNLEKTKTTWDLGTLPNGITYDATTKKFMSTVGGTYVVSYTTSNADFVSLSSTITIADGSESNPFIIDSEEDLKDIGVRTSTLETGDVIRPLNAYYKLAVDLNISASEWTPIGYTLGTANIAEFSGKLDGNGFTITGLNMINNDSGNMKNAGLFYTLSQSGKITNLNLTEVSIIGAYDYAGAFVGINHGTIERSQVSGLIDSTSSNETCTGGITGLNETRVISGLLTSTARIDRVSAVVTVLAGNSDVGLAYAGGLAGKNLGGIIINAYTMNGAGGAIQVRNESSFVGGIVAYNSYIYDDTNPGNISFIDGVVKNTYSTTVVSGGNTLTTKGAIIGFNYNHPDVDLDEEDNLEINRIFGNYYDSTKNSGVIGVSNIADYNDSNTGSIYYNYFSASGKSIEALKQQSTFTACRSYYDEIEMWDFINVWIVDASQNNGFPVLNYTGASIADFPNLIKKANEITTLSGFSDIRKNLSGSYEIIADIDLASVEDWTPIGTKDSPFTGTLLVSNNAKITNLNITTYNKYAGLFGYIGSGAKISGLAIEGVKIVSGEYVGALAGGCAGTIEGCSVKGFDDSYINILYTVESLPQSFNVGGMIGILEGGTVGGEYYESTNTYTYSYVQDLKVMIPMVSNRTVSV
ncbi:MAG: ZmpA/ZmpB/ZmpC family metallo-endopeptidase-related protein, partial [Clostridia bacterium]